MHILETENLSKKYQLGSVNYKTFYQDLQKWSANFLRREDPNLPLERTQRQPLSRLEHWALTNVNLSISQGEKVGIVGKNGAGKSTLLKILSRITLPTAGSARIRGRLSSLLEIGIGFHSDLTGRENIFLNGAILGMKKEEILEAYEAIVRFSELEKYIETPVKRYSSGMYVRLAFSIASHLKTEILVVDEVLAAGDLSFQKKCFQKMREMTENGKTILIVSHNLPVLLDFCDRGILLSEGRITEDDTIKKTVDRYLREEKSEQPFPANADSRENSPGY